MKRLFPLLLALLLAIPALGAAAEEEKVLNIFTWAEYIDGPTVIYPFGDETGIQVNYDFFDSNEEMLMKLQELNAGTYDIVLASDYIINMARDQDLLLPLDWERIANRENIDPRFQAQYFDPDDAFTVPYVAGTPLIIYDPALVEVEITGYESLWDESLRDSLVLMDDMRNVVGITLKSMGESFNVTDPETLAAAAEKLMALRPNIRALDYNQPNQIIASGEASVGYMFTPNILWALEERPDLVLSYPEEGMGFGIDSLFIPKNAPHPDNAHLFLDFILRPEIGKEIAEVQSSLNCNQAAEALLSPAFKEKTDLFFLGAPLEEREYIRDVGGALPTFNEMWMEFKQ